MKTQRGFTLLEVLVALGIVAILALLSWRGLTEVLRSADRVNRVDNELQTTAAIFGQLDRDLSSLNLGTPWPGADQESVALVSQGLIIRTTRRDTSENAFREEIQWLQTAQGLLRTVRRENVENNPNGNSAASNPTNAAPTNGLLPVQGLRIRLWREPGGWTPALLLGNVSPLPLTELNLQGNPLASATAPAGTPAPGGEQTGGEGDTPSPSGRVRAVEVAITPANGQTVMKILLTGGVY
ncbi:MAG TPA: type II secretion system protein [Limnobacter sp.]|uniref:PulJ/GspJ family protein n=1 Tax=Limnobacter sp. TaxID=2003368 RepID=UPI002EDA842B